MSDISQPTKPRRAVHALVWILLFVIMGLVGAFFGYRNGYTRGYANGATPWINQPLEERTYEVGDLAAFKPGDPPDLDLVVDYLGEIHAASWNDLGGPATIEVIGPTEIRVKHTADTHEMITQIFQAIRAGRNNDRDAPKPNGL